MMAGRIRGEFSKADERIHLRFLMILPGMIFPFITWILTRPIRRNQLPVRAVSERQGHYTENPRGR